MCSATLSWEGSGSSPAFGCVPLGVEGPTCSSVRWNPDSTSLYSVTNMSSCPVDQEQPLLVWIFCKSDSRQGRDCVTAHQPMALPQHCRGPCRPAAVPSAAWEPSLATRLAPGSEGVPLPASACSSPGSCTTPPVLYRFILLGP